MLSRRSLSTIQPRFRIFYVKDTNYFCIKLTTLANDLWVLLSSAKSTSSIIESIDCINLSLLKSATSGINQLFADSLNLDEKIRAVAAANIRFDAERKEKENKLLSAQVELQQHQLFFNIYISIALLLLLIISIAYFITKRKANRLLLEKRKQEIQKLMARQQELNRHNELLTGQIEQAMAANNLNTVSQLTGQSLLSKEDENTFRKSFAAIYPLYLPKLREKYPQLTRNEELLAMLICMNQSTDEIALIMGINRSSVNMIRSRMRKKIKLTKEESLDEVIKQYLS